MTRRFWVGARAHRAGRGAAMADMLAPAALSAARRELAAVRPGDAGRAVGRMAVLPARLGLARSPQPQHVHADRPRHRRGLALQRGRHDRCPACFPAGFRGRRRQRRGLFRGRRGHHRRWCCWARCWNCGRASRPAAPSARCSTSRRRPRAASDRRRRRRGDPARQIAARRSAARAPGRRRAGRRRGARGQQRRGRVDGHRRVHAGGEAAPATGSSAAR